ncbi:MAG TPA: GNAT family N-acetyltransferase [Candidatus Kapabacteria bacterium]|nr:GNAT family N-acetyltransferase [Candidatus Kapabacteria bacterium]
MIIIETERLLFRPLAPEDAEDLAALYADPEVMRFFDGMRTRQQAEAEIAECLRRYQWPGFHFWATILKEEQRFIGRCGVLLLTVEGAREYEVAYMIERSCWGRGLATEAARAIKEYGFGRYRFPRMVSLIHPGNHASIRVAEKNGMRFARMAAFNGYVDALFAVERRP